MGTMVNMKPEEKELVLYLAKRVGLFSLHESQFLVWLSEVRKLPKTVDKDTVKKVIDWSTQHDHWTSRAANMGSFVFNFDEIYDQYRGELRKAKLVAAKTQEPESLLKLRKKYGNALKSEIFEQEIILRLMIKKIEVSRSCKECNGGYIRQVREYRERKTERGWHPRHDATDVSCHTCFKIMGPLYVEIFNKLKEEVHGKANTTGHSA